MPTSLEALIIAGVFVVPGLLFERGIEIKVAYWRTGIVERILRFLMWSLAIQIVVAPISYPIWKLSANTPVASMPVWHGLVAWLWLIAVSASSYGFGLLVGNATTAGRKWSTWIIGREAAPTAWDHLWHLGTPGFVRVRLKSGRYLAGWWCGEGQAFASSHPQNEADIFLPYQISVNSTTGEFVMDERNAPKLKNWGLLLRWEEIEALEFLEAWPLKEGDDV